MADELVVPLAALITSLVTFVILLLVLRHNVKARDLKSSLVSIQTETVQEAEAADRRLAAIMFTDIVGFTSFTQRDETLALQLLENHRRLLRSAFGKYSGKEIKTIGDSFLVEFASALKASECAGEIQRVLHDLNLTLPSEERTLIRIGIHLGDVIHSKDDIYGDAVNVASRIQTVADPGGICVTQQVYNDIRGKFEYPIVAARKYRLKNVELLVEIYKILLPWEREDIKEW
jgi:adenylate cyclase